MQREKKQFPFWNELPPKAIDEDRDTSGNTGSQSTNPRITLSNSK